VSVWTRRRDLDWALKTSGLAKYTADLAGQDCVYAAMVRSPYPSARIRSVDVLPALAIPGVLAAVTAEDLPAGVQYIHHGGALADRPPFARDAVHYIGQEIAAVAAETPALARRAAEAVRVEYQRRQAPTTVSEARRPGASPVRPDRETVGNVSLSIAREYGDVPAGRAAASVTASGIFTYPPVTHACMEPNTTMARWDPEARILEIWTSTQAPHFIQVELANALGLDPATVVCREVYVGGGFGSKSKISEHEIAAAALARKLPGRQVLIRLSRAEEFAFTKSRHGMRTDLSLGADATGRLRIVEGDITVDNGAFNHSGPSVMSAGSGTLAEIYQPDGVRFDADLIYTSKQPGGQFRGYGTPQVAFGMESLVDDIAEQLGLDPLELRILNANQPESVTLSGARLQSARLVECLQAVREHLRWDERRDNLPDGHGLGVAVAVHGSGAYAYKGGNRSSARVGIDAQGQVQVWFGGADAGTGQKTIIAQVAASELGCAPEAVSVTMMDSLATPFDMGAWSSRGTYFSAHSVGLAARTLRAMLRVRAADLLGTTGIEIRDGAAHGADGSLSLAEVVRHHPDTRDGLLVAEETYLEERMEYVGGEGPHNKSATYSFAAHGVEVAVDRRTGQVRVVDYVAAHDIGRAINPTMVESQIHGGVMMGLGAALGEQLIHEQGRVVNPAYLNYAMMRFPDAPRVRTILVEGDDAAGPYSAKGIGEIVVVPCAPAVSNAIHHAVGVRLRDLPVTADKVLAGLRGQDALANRVSLSRRPREWWVAGMRRAYPLGVHRALHTYGTRFAREKTPSQIESIVQPTTVDAVQEQLARGGVALGGGSDLIPDGVRTTRDTAVLVSLTNVRELRGILELPDGSLRIGAAVTLAELDSAESIPDALRQAASGVAGPQVREAATVGGNLLQDKRCWFYRNGFTCYKRGGATCPCYAVTGDHSKYHAAIGGHRCQAVTPSDLGTALVALGASVAVRRRGGVTEHVPTNAFYTGPGETVVRPGDLLEAVIIPATSRRRRSTFVKMGQWSGDFAMVSVAVVTDIEAGRLVQPEVVFGAIAPKPWQPGGLSRRRLWDAGEVSSAVEDALVREAHPLPGNGWKLDAAVGLLDTAVERLLQR
jgi:CO/xanthine dehydrogenase Mo-binding subunit/CO/xanthine dehydrogenase FAD-binding subunit